MKHFFNDELYAMRLLFNTQSLKWNLRKIKCYYLTNKYYVIVSNWRKLVNFEID